MLDMMQFDLTLLIIWYVVPLAILFGRGALAANKARKKRQELREIEQNSTPLTRDL